MDRTPAGESVNNINGSSATTTNGTRWNEIRLSVAGSYLGLYLFAAALAADLFFIAAGAGGWRLFSKPLIAAGLFIYFAAAVRERSSGAQKWILPALFFSWLGDVLLLFEYQASLYFLLGLSSFLVAHIFYCLFFLKLWKQEKIKLHLPFLLGVAVYYAGLITLLWPNLGDMKVPVLVYGFVISAMLLLALHSVLLRRSSAARLLIPGAVLFVLSDSLLAVNRFLQPFSLAGVVVMLTYGLAQLLLVKGALTYKDAKKQVASMQQTP